MTEETPYEVTNCDGAVLGRATEKGATWARLKGATIRDTREPEWPSGTLPNGTEWTGNPKELVVAGDVVLRFNSESERDEWARSPEGGASYGIAHSYIRAKYDIPLGPNSIVIKTGVRT